MTKVFAPTGGQWVYSHLDAVQQTGPVTTTSRVVRTRTLTGRAVRAPGTWTDSYALGLTKDQTLVEGPYGTTRSVVASSPTLTVAAPMRTSFLVTIARLCSHRDSAPRRSGMVSARRGSSTAQRRCGQPASRIVASTGVGPFKRASRKDIIASANRGDQACTQQLARICRFNDRTLLGQNPRRPSAASRDCVVEPDMDARLLVVVTPYEVSQ